MNTRGRNLATDGTERLHVAATPTATPAAISLERAKWQQVLFAPTPKWRSVLELVHSWPVHPILVRVHRNHAFEPVEAVLRQYLAFAGFTAEFVYSQYDDSLSLDAAGSATVELVWLDVSPYSSTLTEDEVAQWVGSRLAELRQRTAAPILVLLG